jgi:hypothetical protein
MWYCSNTIEWTIDFTVKIRISVNSLVSLSIFCVDWSELARLHLDLVYHFSRWLSLATNITYFVEKILALPRSSEWEVVIGQHNVPLHSSMSPKLRAEIWDATLCLPDYSHTQYQTNSMWTCISSNMSHGYVPLLCQSNVRLLSVTEVAIYLSFLFPNNDGFLNQIWYNAATCLETAPIYDRATL